MGADEDIEASVSVVISRRVPNVSRRGNSCGSGDVSIQAAGGAAVWRDRTKIKGQTE
jgi:hypothetical protein